MFFILRRFGKIFLQRHDYYGLKVRVQLQRRQMYKLRALLSRQILKIVGTC
jgi:hypothetical protein